MTDKDVFMVIAITAYFPGASFHCHGHCFIVHKPDGHSLYTCFIGVGRFRILGGGKVKNMGGGQGGPNSQWAHDIVLTSMRRHFDVMCPLGF